MRFALGSAHTFSRRDTVSDSERFYLTLYDFLTDPEEGERIAELLEWWDQYVRSVSIRHRLAYNRHDVVLQEGVPEQHHLPRRPLRDLRSGSLARRSGSL